MTFWQIVAVGFLLPPSPVHEGGGCGAGARRRWTSRTWRGGRGAGAGFGGRGEPADPRTRQFGYPPGGLGSGRRGRGASLVPRRRSPPRRRQLLFDLLTCGV